MVGVFPCYPLSTISCAAGFGGRCLVVLSFPKIFFFHFGRTASNALGAFSFGWVMLFGCLICLSICSSVLGCMVFNQGLRSEIRNTDTLDVNVN